MKCALCDKKLPAVTYDLVEGGAIYCSKHCANKVGSLVLAEIQNTSV